MVITNLVVGGLLVGCIYALFAVGLTLSLGVMRVLNVAHGAILSLAGILAVQAIGNVPGVDSLPAVIVLAMLIGGAAGLLIDFFAIQPAKRAEKLSPSQVERATLIGTLAFLYAFDAVSTTRTNAQAVSLPLSVFKLRSVKIGSVMTSNAEIGAFFCGAHCFFCNDPHRSAHPSRAGSSSDGPGPRSCRVPRGKCPPLFEREFGRRRCLGRAGGRLDCGVPGGIGLYDRGRPP